MNTREQEISKHLSPAELMLWHGMGAEVHPSRLADLKDALIRETLPKEKTCRPRPKEPIEYTSDRVTFSGQANAKPVVWRGATYRSIAAACRATGVSKTMIRRWLKEGEPSNYMPVIAHGVRYRSMNKAAEGLHIPITRLRHILMAGTDPAIQFEKQDQGAENGATNGSEARRRDPATSAA